MRAGIAITAALALMAGRADQPKCGTDRWAVKTWEDADATAVDTIPQPTSVQSLAGLEIPEVPYPANGRLAPIERRIFRLRAQVARISTEDDGDWHVILRDPADARYAIIAEVPDPRCVKSSTLQATFAAVRDSLRRVPRQGYAVVQGIGFWDFLHTQRGGAANGIELHPLTLIIPERR